MSGDAHGQSEPAEADLPSETPEERTSATFASSDEFRKLVIESLPDFIVLLDREHRQRWVNRVAPGLALKDVIGAPIDNFVAPSSIREAKRVVDSVFQTGQPGQYEVEGYGDGVESAWYLTRVVPVTPRPGQPIENVLLITADVTHRKRAELALRESEERFRALAEHSPDLIGIINRAHEIEYVNRDSAELLGRPVESLIRAEQQKEASRIIDCVFETGKPAEYEASTPLDDSIYRVRVAPFEWTGGHERVLMVSSDITKARIDEQARESLQAQLHQVQRRESIGTLAGGIAHDFNNLLQVIQTNLHFAQELLEPTGLAREELSEVMRAVERAAELTTHLLTIGRRQRVDSKVVDLSKLMERSLRMLRRVIPENIELVYEGTAAPCPVSGDPPQLEQVLLNLCLNARDAMPLGGTLCVSVDAIDGDGTPLVELSVSDTGSGITEETSKRLFEPFFTTRGAGSGLGLAIVSGIVAAHSGSIRVESKLGEGSTFVVRLPRVSATGEEREPAPTQRDLGNELILVAEDEPLVRSQVVRVLKGAGYSVLEAENGIRALELFHARHEEIKLVLLDVIMPGLDGWQVYSRLEAQYPAVKVLFTTGYAANALPENFVTKGKRLLSKPYKPQALLEAVREVLDLG